MFWKSAAIAVVVLAMTLSACDSKSGSGPTTSSSPVTSTSLATTTTVSTSAPSMTTSTTAIASSTSCGHSALSVAPGRTKVAAGTDYLGVTFTNSGTTTCFLEGYPGISLFGKSGTPVAVTESHRGGLPIFAVPPRRVSLGPGSYAGFVLSYSYTPGASAKCMSSITASVAVPKAGTFLLPKKLSLCSGAGLAISALVGSRIYEADFGGT